MLGARIRSLRKQAGLSQTELAERAGIHMVNLSRIESKPDSDPKYKTLLKIADGLGVHVVQLVMEESLYLRLRELSDSLESLTGGKLLEEITG